MATRVGTERLFDHAERAVTAGRRALAVGSAERAAERAHATAVLAARAVLNEAGLRLRAHAAIWQAFSRLLPANDFDADLLVWVDGMRSARDGIDVEPTYEEAADMIETAARFLAAAREAASRVQPAASAGASEGLGPGGRGVRDGSQ